MSWDNELFLPSEENIIPKLPLEIKVIDDSFKLSISKFKKEINGVPKETGIVFCTSGLAKLGQKELRFILVNTSRCTNKTAENVVLFFKKIYTLVSQNNFINHGNVTDFNKEGLLGKMGAIFLDSSESIEEWKRPIFLDMILLNKNETEAVKTSGWMRIASMLGNQSRFYPYPFWTDLNRKSLETGKMFSESLINKVSGKIFLDVSVSLVNSIIQFQIKETSASNIPLNKIDKIDAISILPNWNKNTDSCLTFSFDFNKNGPAAISLPPDKGEFTGGCILYVLSKQREYNARIIEDGFCIFLTESQWEQFWYSVINRKNTRIGENHSMPLVISI